MAYKLLANYEKEQALFTEFVASDAEPNILLFQGESGSGKSHLVEHCLSTVPEMHSHFMKLQSGQDSISSLFTNMGRRVGWDKLPYFSNTVANLVEKPAGIEAAIWNAGMHRHLREIGKIGDIESRLSRYQLLSDAWFADAAQFDTPFLLAIDTYENVTTFFDRWFREDFLIGVANSSQMRVLVSGQKVPEAEADWSFCASLQELQGVHEAEAWMKWAQDVGYQVPSLEVLSGVVLALHGNPSKIIDVIQTQFPRSQGTIESKESIKEQRKRFFKNLTEAFDLQELRKTCFFLGIDYELFPNHTQKDGFVIELLGYAERRGRLKEVIQEFQAERPHLEW